MGIIITTTLELNFTEPDSLVDSLIINDANCNQRLMSYHEFNEAYMEPTLHKTFETIVYIFHNFHPKTRPVLWRILLTQLHIYQTIKNTRVQIFQLNNTTDNIKGYESGR